MGKSSIFNPEDAECLLFDSTKIRAVGFMIYIFMVRIPLSHQFLYWWFATTLIGLTTLVGFRTKWTEECPALKATQNSPQAKIPHTDLGLQDNDSARPCVSRKRSLESWVVGMALRLQCLPTYAFSCCTINFAFKQKPHVSIFWVVHEYFQISKLGKAIQRLIEMRCPPRDHKASTWLWLG